MILRTMLIDQSYTHPFTTRNQQIKTTQITATNGITGHIIYIPVTTLCMWPNTCILEHRSVTRSYPTVLTTSTVQYSTSMLFQATIFHTSSCVLKLAISSSCCLACATLSLFSLSSCCARSAFCPFNFVFSARSSSTCLSS